MPIKEFEEVVVVTGKEVFISKYGYTTKTVGDGTATVKLPAHMVAEFREKGFVV